MPDARISELPAASPPADTDLAPLVQTSGTSLVTNKATVSQLRAAVLDGRGAHVRDYGAKGDGVTDDAPAIQAAINALAAKKGGVLHFDARTYRLASAITIGNVAVRLQGQGFVEGASPGHGTWFKVDATGFTPITFNNTGARGGGIADIALYQNHAATQNASWAPTNYDFFIRIQNCQGGVDIANLYLCGINKGIYSSNSGRLDVNRLRGQVFTTGLEVDDAFDVVRVRGVHFWPFWSSNTYVMQYTQALLDTLVFRRVDGLFLDQAFVLGARSMFRFSGGLNGVTTKFYIGQAYADFCQYGVLVEGAGTDGLIDSLTTQGQAWGVTTAIPASNGIRISAPNCRLQVGKLRCDLVQDNAIRLEQYGNRVDVFALRCVNFNAQNNGSAAIHLVDSGSNTANAVYLGSPALLEGVTGPLQNSGGNGVLATGTPPGSAARPGLAVGSTNTGLWLPAGNTLAASAGGAEVLRATASGGITLGGAPNGHAFEVTTPLATGNRILASGAASGGAVSLTAQGIDANISLQLAGKGSGTVQASGPLQVSSAGGGNLVRLAGAASGGAVVLGVDATSADPNVGVVLGAPKGTGAIAAQQADGSSTGGNARGANAVDWQTVRTTAGQVASGANSAILGGAANSATGQYSLAHGNSCSASGLAAIALGDANLASGSRAVALGVSCTADGIQSVALGRSSHAHGLQGALVHSGNRVAANGDAQAGQYVLMGRAAGATVRLTADGSAAGSTNVCNLPNNTAWCGSIHVVARDTVTGNCARWAIPFGLGRVATAASTVLTTGTVEFQNVIGAVAASGNLASAADTTNGGLSLTFTPANGNTWDVVAVLRTAEVQ